MAFEHIMLNKQEQIATIVLNRPRKLNALTYKMLQELLLAIDDIAADDNIRVAVLTGAGRAFCAGADFMFSGLKEGKIDPFHAEELDVQMRAAGAGRGRLLTIVHKAVFAIQHLEKPVIAMVNGDAVGGGFGLSLACDMAIGSPNTRFMIGYPLLGYAPNLGEIWMLPRVVGLRKAIEIIMTCEFVNGEEALRIGLLNKVVPEEDLEAETRRMAKSIMKVAPIAQRFIKQQIYSAMETDPRTSLLFGYACNLLAMGAKDHVEALMAFAERRSPNYQDAPLYQDK